MNQVSWLICMQQTGNLISSLPWAYFGSMFHRLVETGESASSVFFDRPASKGYCPAVVNTFYLANL